MARFEKGAIKPPSSGRKKGQRNKVTAEFSASLRSLNFDCAVEAVQLYRSGDLKPCEQVTLLEMITSYAHYKPKPIEHTVQEFLDFRQMSEQDALAALSESDEDE
jgi:hypothetical protein